jgi:hypothetical protein
MPVMGMQSALMQMVAITAAVYKDFIAMDLSATVWRVTVSW